MSMAVVMIGSVVKGFRVVGPFANLAEAEAWTNGYEEFEAMAVVLKDPETPWQELIDPWAKPAVEP
jgi:hypothetical protein